MKTFICDIEANGLYDTVSQVHCIVIKEKGTKNVRTYYDNNRIALPNLPRTGTILEGIAALEKADCVVGHNFIDYDIRVIKKLYPDFKFDIKKIRDTLIRSYLSNPHRERHPNCPPTKPTVDGRKPIGAHSLENFGYVVGRGKVEHEDWITFTSEMLHRCVEDVQITDLVDDYLAEEMSDWSWKRSENIEKHFRFILSEQEAYGWLVDKKQLERCLVQLEAELNLLDKELYAQIPLRVVGTKKPTKALGVKGKVTSVASKWFDNQDNIIAGEFSKVKFEQINLNSDKQLKDFLLTEGWIPTEWNYKKIKKRFIKDDSGSNIKLSPKLTDDSLESVKGTCGKLIVRRIQLRHRQSQIQGWKERVRSDGRIGAGGNSCGTNTGRVTHRTVVNVPKAEDGVFFGKEMRSIFAVKKDYSLVGADLSALENRIAAHFTWKYDGGEYAARLLSGDPHQYLADRWGYSRSSCKNVNYAIMYGAQFLKIQSMLGCGPKKARYLFSDWWEVNPALKELKERLENSLEKRGEKKGGQLSKHAFIKGIDGRKIFVRSWHSIMNSLFQNAGSMVNKVATIKIYKRMQEQGIRGHFVGNFHDEIQAEIHKDDIKKYKKIVLQSFKEAGEFFELNIPIEGECKVGANWCQTH